MRCLSSVHSFCHVTAIRFKVALNVAVPACSLCINRRLYKIATMKTVVFSSSEKRRAVFYDLLIGVGIPILQIISGECLTIHRQPVVDKDAIQSMLFQRIVTTYLRIMALISLW
jgi:pheromone A receptor